MSVRKPRWEIVRGDTGWWARFRASNGQLIAHTEIYTRRERALRAVLLVGGPHRGQPIHVGCAGGSDDE